ncbi:hypothetical protein KP509_30G074700 [Ceratopteris richardii]|uniref:C2 domain-containing protein n=1 Tax=Ceratopteris richardii TaxID=49495 RepID=A0A8T2R5I0_CERRI|nr:hypothetical protein KP509_30G074700 [Ceratopteris richardii]
MIAGLSTGAIARSSHSSMESLLLQLRIDLLHHRYPLLRSGVSSDFHECRTRGLSFCKGAPWKAMEVTNEDSGYCSFRSSRTFRRRSRRRLTCRFKMNHGGESSSLPRIETTDTDRPPFDINVAVVLAGFAFEAYNTPSDQGRASETDPFGCKTTFLSERFIREVYSGKMFIHLKSGSKFPGLDFWGTSDPYVVLRIGESVVRSKTLLATTTPVWNERFEINVQDPSSQFLQVAVWDANLMTDDRRLGNFGVDLKDLCDGEKHEVTVELEGMGGGGVLNLEVQYRCFEDIEKERKGWTIPVLSDLFQGKSVDDVFKSMFGLESLTVQEYLRSVLGDAKQKSDNIGSDTNNHLGDKDTNITSTDDSGKGSLSMTWDTSTSSDTKKNSQNEGKECSQDSDPNIGSEYSVNKSDALEELGRRFQETFGINLENVGFPVFDKVCWDALDVINKLALEQKKKSEFQYVEEGLALSETREDSVVAVENGVHSPENQEDISLAEPFSDGKSTIQVEDVQTASSFLLKHMESTLKSWAVLASPLTGPTRDENTRIAIIKDSVTLDPKGDGLDTSVSKSGEQLCSPEELEEMRKMFCKAESAIEAWALLASSLGHKSFIKSAFEKICFLENEKTDTQVALWRDTEHRRLVIAFRGTEQVKWKDLRTDLMLLPVSIGNPDDKCPWQVYVTGHSLGGALATLAALELSTTKMSSQQLINISMYNFGSPRVGNKKFADRYNEIVKDSWRVVNHLDIIPNVPRLMGYCHVATPIYLTAGDVEAATVNMELISDGYNGDVIGEATPDFLLEEFMKGEKQLIERLLQTEIAMIQSIRSGSALMQHMEDFYYISLLQSARQRLPKLQISQAKAEIDGVRN